ncbi:hypothetical protein CI238_11371 [Colletotrichum incanum]|uniref:Uncharacterized protein n=1 Tax=Colletotrichum incanum TaxID=1573173 RepID=A0A167D872_COLIC|nr:hypothetical protein CI238_11371 [Colletotrichum incanum]
MDAFRAFLVFVTGSLIVEKPAEDQCSSQQSCWVGSILSCYGSRSSERVLQLRATCAQLDTLTRARRRLLGSLLGWLGEQVDGNVDAVMAGSAGPELSTSSDGAALETLQLARNRDPSRAVQNWPGTTRLMSDSTDSQPPLESTFRHLSLGRTDSDKRAEAPSPPTGLSSNPRAARRAVGEAGTEYGGETARRCRPALSPAPRTWCHNGVDGMYGPVSIPLLAALVVVLQRCLQQPAHLPCFFSYSRFRQTSPVPPVALRVRGSRSAGGAAAGAKTHRKTT